MEASQLAPLISIDALFNSSIFAFVILALFMVLLRGCSLRIRFRSFSRWISFVRSPMAGVQSVALLPFSNFIHSIPTAVELVTLL